jgi:L-aspartate oxidase
MDYMPVEKRPVPGVHGANRLASNSLLEGIVFGQRIVDKAGRNHVSTKNKAEEIIRSYDPALLYRPERQRIDSDKARRMLQDIMWENVGIIRDEKGLMIANNQVEEIYIQLAVGDSWLNYYETINMLTVARIIIQAALWRRESRGAHYGRIILSEMT